MGRTAASRDKVTLSLPRELIRYADDRAKALATSRSQVVAEALSVLRERDEDELAREGYAFYAEESEVFADESVRAVSEALDHAG
jgi:metal-responsive CopG/Arc/MetJ family transcriptional regulator